MKEISHHYIQFKHVHEHVRVYYDRDVWLNLDRADSIDHCCFFIEFDS